MIGDFSAETMLWNLQGVQKLVKKKWGEEETKEKMALDLSQKQ